MAGHTCLPSRQGNEPHTVKQQSRWLLVVGVCVKIAQDMAAGRQIDRQTDVHLGCKPAVDKRKQGRNKTGTKINIVGLLTRFFLVALVVAESITIESGGRTIA